MSGDRGMAGRKSSRYARAAGAGAVAVLVATAGAALGASTDFFEPASSPEPAYANPSMVAAADLDGDADTDLAVTNTFSDTVSVLKNNNGTGNFFPAPSTESVGDEPRGIVAADLDGDADRDLAVTNFNTATVSILRNNGSGNFFQLPSSPETVGTVPSAVAAGDLDGDGDVDLAVSNQSTDNITVLKNNGAGNFFQPPSSPEAAGDSPTHVVAVDLDGDSDLDLAAPNPVQNRVRILKNNGTGNFFEAASSPEVVGADPVRIAAADLDGDADQDLAVVLESQGAITVLKNQGNGNFFEPNSSPEDVGNGPFGIVAADFDGDTDRDLAVTNRFDNDVSILRNNMAGNFSEPITSAELVGASPWVLAAADLDGDSDPDLAIPQFGTNPGEITILLNR